MLTRRPELNSNEPSANEARKGEERGKERGEWRRTGDEASEERS